LSTEAIAAFVDNELRLTPHLRAANHLSLCPQCAAEVDAQRQARSALRDSLPIAVPRSLLGQLSQIPLYSAETAAEHTTSIQDPRLADGAGDTRRKRR
jgi:anti-sigma factor RsiW